MKSFTTAAVLLAAATAVTASPTARLAKRQTTCIVNTVTNPSQTDVENSINQWNTDVITVNNFLNTANTLLNSSDALLAAAQTANTNAQDEPCQLMTLASQPDFSSGPAAFTCAVQDLMNVFQIHVLDNLATIIADPTNTGTVQSAIDDINVFRCCNVLPDASILWQDSAEDNGIGNVVATVAPTENACLNIVCTPQCTQEDNGSFGTPGI